MRVWEIAACAALVLFARPASADTLWAPVGGHAVPVGLGHVACPSPAPDFGWSVTATGDALRPPTSDGAVGKLTSVALAKDLASCGAATETLSLVAVGPTPDVDRASILLDVDAGSVSLSGRALAGATLRWSTASGTGTDTCSSPVTQGNAVSCTFAVARGLAADPSSLRVTLLPAGAPAAGIGYDAQGRRVDDTAGLAPARVTIRRLFKDEPNLDSGSPVSRLALAHPEAVAAVECPDASCNLDGDAVTVRDVRSTSDRLELRFALRPHVALARGAIRDTAPSVQIALRRCPVALASSPPLRDVRGQRGVVRVADACARDPELELRVDGVLVAPERVEDGPTGRWFVLPFPAPPDDELEISAQHGRSVLGVARVRTRGAIDLRPSLDLPGLGAIDFLPTNREARVFMPSLERGVLVPRAVDNVYSVRRAADGSWRVRADAGARGAVALRFAYRDPTLPAPFDGVDLAHIEETTARSLKPANVPVALGALAAAEHPLVELWCGDHRVPVGRTTALPFSARDECRLLLHRERLRPEDGTQVVQVVIKVLRSDGSQREEVGVDQRVTLRPAAEPRVLYLAGAAEPFDRAIVRVSLVNDDLHYAVSPDERVAAPQAQWAVVFGRDHFRIYATTAIPTGLFRVADRAHSGILTLNAGALFRCVLLSSEGQESPVGLEAGAMWLGIAGDQVDSPRGQVALVGGLGVGVPIANPSRATQTSINLHLWGEYEISRDLEKGGVGTPFGLVFGPSLSIGNVGTNF